MVDLLSLWAGKYDGVWYDAEDYTLTPGDHGLKMGSAGRLHAIAAPIEGGLRVADKTLVVQYEVKLHLSSSPFAVTCAGKSDGLMGQVKALNGVGCDGSYLKLLQEDAGRDLAKFDNDARYTIMFGPDRCGSTDKVHSHDCGRSRYRGPVLLAMRAYPDLLSGPLYSAASEPRVQEMGGEGGNLKISACVAAGDSRISLEVVPEHLISIPS